MNSVSVKDKDMTFQVKLLKRQKKFPNNQNQRINFKESLQDKNVGLILILTGLKTDL